MHESSRQGYKLCHLEIQYSIGNENVFLCAPFVMKWSMKISQVDCGSYSVYLYSFPLRSLSLLFLQNNIKETDALILLFPIVLQRECVSPKAMLKVVPAIAASKGLLP